VNDVFDDTTALDVTEHDTSREVPPGPFLDELKVNGLVTCKFETTYDTNTTLVF
jgi:hypothetical protein